MLPSVHRLRRSADFQRVVRRGRRVSSPTMVLHSCPGATPSSPAQVGFVVSRAVGNAVVRNRVKRRLRHEVAARIQTFPGRLLVVRAAPAAAEADSRQLGADLDRCLTAMTIKAERRASR